MNLGHGLGHLAYSTLVHQTDNWEQLWKSVNTYLPAVKARVAPHEKFGVCLRTSAPSAELLSAEPSKVADLKKFFADNDLYLYTANAFVYGVFKKQVIKEDVYEPDWATPERREYTKKSRTSSPSSLPRGSTRRSRAHHSASSRRSPVTMWSRRTPNVIDVVAHLVELKKKTGKTVTLGLEPEPRATSRRPTKPSPTSRTACSPVPPRSGSQSRPASTKPMPRRPCEITPASSSTSVTRRSATRTSRRRCRSWWTAACRS